MTRSKGFSDDIVKEAPKYRPSVFIDRAPQLSMPLLFVVTGWLSALGLGVAVAHLAGLVAHDQWGAMPVLGMVHLATLGFLTMTMMGVLNQWIPVVFNVPAERIWPAVLHYVLYTSSVATFVSGFFDRSPTMLGIGAGGVSLAIIWFSIRMVRAIAAAERVRDAVTYIIYAALSGLNIIWILGVVMVIGIIHLRSNAFWIPLHISTALVGWIGLLVMAVQLKLVPMFSMGKTDQVRLGLPAWLAGIGLLAYWTGAGISQVRWISSILWMSATIAAILQIRAILQTRRTQSVDVVLVIAYGAWILWFLAALCAFWDPAMSVILMFCGAFLFIFGYQARIFPFMIAVAVSRKLPGPVFKAFFMAQSLQAKRTPLIVAGSTLAAFGLLLWGVTHQTVIFVFWAGVLWAAVVVFHLTQLAWGIRRGYKDRHNLPERPAPGGPIS